MILALSRALARFEKVLLLIAAAFLFTMMVIVFADVGLRYLFNSPLGFSYDLISLYLMVGVFFFSLSNTLRHDEHVRVDILYLQAPPSVRRMFDRISYALSAILFAVVLWMGLLRAIASTAQLEVMATLIPWPIWLAYWIVPIGTAPILMLCVLRVIHPEITKEHHV
ncbi:TRAP transporter small permease subunit [Aquabacter sp. L1I39]|uniref:TRAP transporter small permease n=1 Tax=Aquabacter sp. L1I39 TaxID=2820278 RepID=UPI001ADCDE52|nr:TRAP transporter small permease subunit [Aquabacter sp. L1I39]QTL03766.1 TRAP transporter small permease subunit [Aquabacter sp. L1I39]